MKTSLLALVLLSTTATAASTVNITVSGTLTRPPCVLSTGTTLTAEFGNVRTDQVASTGTVAVPVRMTCPAGSSLNVSFTSSRGTHTTTVAKTSVSNLGVSLLWADDTAANLTGTAKAYSNLSGNVDISLKAKLVERGALAPSAFTSSMVMTINYL
ncbi:minor fimbrial subunit [Pseudomonas cuatrocienegasensis]|uniref:Minor fimbrial subunit n=1 Tax=Pseudomonas cuatrocienegasensis TaxID=543360 RepID=A0ABY1BPM7_9PSED|nr:MULTISPECIES: fimbrial protein [Pseudomonas]OEC33762.1 fimbrial protein [Pseudomonas sp. 21C1]SER31930.1 minor fimbrial subunit [Pseudomonas cuatrocienegasensis]